MRERSAGPVDAPAQPVTLWLWPNDDGTYSVCRQGTGYLYDDEVADLTRAMRGNRRAVTQDEKGARDA